ncbi:flavin reductase family protein [Bermanella sp. R86510]|uniref:flavin reductase family protein n=1 Tax=unclassified Bermanella TaxID=2627862 RepID=UPI0037CB50D8
MSSHTKSANTQGLWGWLAKSLTTHSSFTAYFEPVIQWFKPVWRADRVHTQVMDVRQESSDMYSLVLKPKSSFYTFEAGQYVELTIMQNGAWVSRFFTLSSSPEYFAKTGLIELSIAVQEKGKVTPWIPHNLKYGDYVNLNKPLGDFCPLQSHKKRLLFISGGSGITPFRATLQQLKEQPEAHFENIHLFYYARSANHFLFKQELEAIADTQPNVHVTFIDSQEKGFFDWHHIIEATPDITSQIDSTDFYVCGPAPMIQHVRKQLKQNHVPAQQIYFEFFGPEPIEVSDSTETHQVLFEKSGIQAPAMQSPSLLELAEQTQLKPVSGCRIGVCHQCICKKQSGRVLNRKTGKISDSGQEEIQLCISTAVDDVVLSL